MKTVHVATYDTLSPARELCRLLEEAGVRAYIHDESWVERFWFWSEPLAAIHVEVSPADFTEARKLIREWDLSRGVLREAVRCPECHSSRIEFPQITRKFLMPVVQVLFMTLHVIPRHFYCEDCQFTWPKEKPVEPERDILGWPVNSRLWHPENFRKPEAKKTR